MSTSNPFDKLVVKREEEEDEDQEFTLKSKYKKSNITTIQKLNNINLLSLPKKKGKLINLKTIEITILKEKKNETKEKENYIKKKNFL